MQPPRERTEKSSSRSSRSSSPQPTAPQNPPAPAKRSLDEGGDSFVRIATVARAHGLRGHVVVDIDSTMAELAVPGLAIRLEKTSGGCLDSKITSARASGSRMVWSVAMLGDRTAAEAWAGAAVLIDKAALPATGEDEYFDFELLGAAVFDSDGALIGTVREIVATGANDVLVAHGPCGEILIPATRVAIIDVDRVGQRIVVDARALVYQDEREGS